jgi:hypothetical protein
LCIRVPEELFVFRTNTHIIISYSLALAYATLQYTPGKNKKEASNERGTQIVEVNGAANIYRTDVKE